MKIIPPYQITSEILNLIHEAESYLILVSPYVNFNNWESLKNALSNASKRKVNIKFYCRLENDNFKSWEQLEAIGIKPKLVKNLHSKLYFNEKSGIVTSMNLLTSSNLNAIEFGSIYHTQDELEELKSYVKKYLEPNVEKEIPNEDDLYLAKEKFLNIVNDFLSGYIDCRVYCKWQNGSLVINANNTYYAEIDKVKNTFSITGVVSGIESEQFETFCALSNAKSLNLSLTQSVSSFTAYSTKSLTHSNFDFLKVAEKKELLDYILLFISELNDFKEQCYYKSKSKTL